MTEEKPIHYKTTAAPNSHYAAMKLEPIEAMANTDQMAANLKQMAADWLACADADQADINRYDSILVDALPPAGDAMIESDEDRAKRFLAIRDMRMVAVTVRRNCAYELQMYLARQKVNPPMGGSVAPSTDCESA